jgi:hypothetical protein
VADVVYFVLWHVLFHSLLTPKSDAYWICISDSRLDSEAFS